MKKVICISDRWGIIPIIYNVGYPAIGETVTVTAEEMYKGDNYYFLSEYDFPDRDVSYIACNFIDAEVEGEETKVEELELQTA